jgi:hypothetical protein
MLGGFPFTDSYTARALPCSFAALAIHALSSKKCPEGFICAISTARNKGRISRANDTAASPAAICHLPQAINFNLNSFPTPKIPIHFGLVADPKPSGARKLNPIAPNVATGQAGIVMLAPRESRDVNLGNGSVRVGIRMAKRFIFFAFLSA